jgi:hypothetical protein
MYVKKEVTMKMNSTIKQPPCTDFAVKGKKASGFYFRTLEPEQ